MVNVLPSRMKSDFIPLAALILLTDVPYFRAMPDSVSPFLIV